MQNLLIKTLAVGIAVSGLASGLNAMPLYGADNLLINQTIDTINVTETNQKKLNKNINWKKGWVTTDVNIRKKPNTKSKILDTLKFNDKIKFVRFNKKWVKIKYKGKEAYVSRKYITKKKVDSDLYDLPAYSGYKSWMDYQMITASGSPQKLLQDEYAYTGTYGIRQINGRYCVAIGSYFTTEIGQYFDLILENGTVIPCILADQKADEDTDDDGIFTLHNGCATEFIIDFDCLNYAAKRDGDISSCADEWDSPVETIRVYEKNVLDE